MISYYNSGLKVGRDISLAVLLSDDWMIGCGKSPGVRGLCSRAGRPAPNLSAGHRCGGAEARPTQPQEPPSAGRVTSVNRQQVKRKWIRHLQLLILMLNTLRDPKAAVLQGGPGLGRLPPHSQARGSPTILVF